MNKYWDSKRFNNFDVISFEEWDNILITKFCGRCFLHIKNVYVFLNKFPKCNEYYLNNTTFQTMCMFLDYYKSTWDRFKCKWFLNNFLGLYLYSVFHISYFVNRKCILKKESHYPRMKNKDVCFSYWRMLKS